MYDIAATGSDLPRIGAQRPRLQLLPTNAASSAGEEAERLANACGLFLDDWQSWCLHHMLSEDPAGRWAASVVLLLLPRQNGKNAVLEALELAAIFLFGEKLIIHSAHLADTARGHMERMKALVQANPELDAITKFYDANGKERMVRTDTGAQIRFITRGQKTLRGGSPSRIVFDEALYLTDIQVQAIVPSLSAQSLNAEGPPQMIYTSSAPLAVSEVLHRVRKTAQEGEAGNFFYAEWGCDLADIEDLDITDRDLWYAMNPGLGIRISEAWIEDNELMILTPEGFMIERLGIVQPLDAEHREPKLPQVDWAASVQPFTPDIQPGEPTLVFDVDIDSGSASIAIGHGTISDPYVELIEHQERTDWLPDRIVALVKKWQPTAVACNGAGPAGAMVGPVQFALAQAGLDYQVRQFNGQEYQQACGGIYASIVQGELSRPPGQGPLDLAGEDATDRPLGDAWVWDRRSATVPISPLVAITIARALLPIEAPGRSVFAY